MPEDESQALIPVERSSKLEKSISSFSPAVAGFLRDVGLPTENILSPVEERRKVINELKNALEVLPMEERQKAYYLTKFTVAVAVGLFDGALNYLWDETISALRRLVGKVDLAYFFAVWTALVIPPARIARFRASLRVKPDSHSAWPNNSARTSSQGINSTVPASISAKRRLISSDQAASTSGSETGSSVSISNPARVARSRSGNCAAS